jgi:F1F0 ATPase subunit 2
LHERIKLRFLTEKNDRDKAMTDAGFLVLAFTTGMALGAFFSLNLWATVRKMTNEHTPWYILVGNFMLRMGVVLAGFYIVMAGHWERLLAALLGFVLMREILVHRLGRKPKMT